MGDSLKKHLDEDTQLMLQVGRGNSQAFDRLYKKYYPIVIDYLINLDGYKDSINDIAQKVFLCI